MAKKPEPIDLKQETADISAKIAASYLKLAGKFREKAQRAAEKMKDIKSEEKRALQRRRFELYGDAAGDLEDRLRHLQGTTDKDRDQARSGRAHKIADRTAASRSSSVIEDRPITVLLVKF